MEIPESYVLHDMRTGRDFKGITICGYKRRDVIKAFQNCIINNKLEDAIRWAVELHTTGLNKEIWNSFEMIYTKYIHINNPKLFFYYLKREKEYQNILKKYPKKHEIFTRNNQEIRNLYAELTAIFANTKKNNLFLPKSLPTINDKTFAKEEIRKRMIATNMDGIIEYCFNTTTNEMKLALNEILTNISTINGTFQNCIFWYLWLEKIQSKRKNNDILFEPTNTLEDPYHDNWTFILWRIILSFENRMNKNDFIFLKKMESVYKNKFKPSSIGRKKFYFFISFFVLKNIINWNITLYPLEHMILQTNANINIMYKNIIKYIENNLTEEQKDILHKKYYQMYYSITSEVIMPKKMVNTSLDEDINRVVPTNYPEYYDIQNENGNSNYNEAEYKQMMKASKKKREKMVSMNKTERDVIDEREHRNNKKIEAFTQFISYKDETRNKPKIKRNVYDFFSNEEINKNIIFEKRK